MQSLVAACIIMGKSTERRRKRNSAENSLSDILVSFGPLVKFDYESHVGVISFKRSDNALILPFIIGLYARC